MAEQDDFSRYGYIYLIKEKSSALDKFKIYKAEVENQLNLKIKVVRSDRGGEYYGRYDETGRNPGPFAKFLQEEGIIAQYTNPGTPQQNGISERRNRTLKDMIRSMMSCTNLPIFLWGEALKTTNYILNRTPTKSINRIPYEVWNGRKLSIKHLRVWGCKAEAKPYNPVEKKLDPKTISGYFVGYPERTKGYRFYCPKHTTRFIETSRAVFIETDQERDEEESFSFEEITLNHDMPQISNEDIIRLPQIDSSNTQLGAEHDVNVIEDPATFKQAMTSEKRENWFAAMKLELNSMEKNGVWKLVTLPQGCKPIGCKWAYKTKLDSKGQTDRSLDRNQALIPHVSLY
ncbi:hypothetical protein L3X38_012466 [Prunus dulcis]|uniref:Integrase catalytic domain-containing protein n=1 Tax=Prunus dulcis TaxID=3755 RepID=A0AAD4ZG35_PRUDU|nr:hypothetical protein L3X38_012466 [Prunus dulcis]